MRVPLIAAWAKRNGQNPNQTQLAIPANVIQSQPAAVIDLFPTILTMTGTEAPANHPVDGSSLQTLLLGKSDKTRSPTFLMHYPHSPHRSDYFTCYRDGDWKVIYHYRPSKASDDSHYQLYNLASDPFEQNNLAESNPKQLKKMMQKLVASLDTHDALMPVTTQDGTEALKPQLP